MEKVMIDEDRLIVETQEIFKYLDRNIYNKIPEKIRSIINEYKGKYEFTYDIDKELNEQNISQPTKDLIVGLYYRYAASEESKKIILNNIEKYENETIKKEKELNEKYSADKLFKNKNESVQEVQSLTIKKDSIFKKIINKILFFFLIG